LGKSKHKKKIISIRKYKTFEKDVVKEDYYDSIMKHVVDVSVKIKEKSNVQV